MEFCNTEFIIKLAYLADVFRHLNEMNVCLQGRDVTVSDVQDKLAGLSARISVWQARIKAGSTASFPLLDEYLRMNRIELPVDINTCIKDHLQVLCAEFQSYFNDPPLYVSWHKNPFNVEVDPNAEEAEELSELKVSNGVKVAFKSRSDISSFWLSLHDAYPLLSKKASEMYVQCSTTYLCKTGFSDLATIKTKARNRLDVRSDIRLAVSKTEPNIKGLLKQNQAQVSH